MYDHDLVMVRAQDWTIPNRELKRTFFVLLCFVVCFIFFFLRDTGKVKLYIHELFCEAFPLDHRLASLFHFIYKYIHSREFTCSAAVSKRQRYVVLPGLAAWPQRWALFILGVQILL